jgi:DNA repair protein
MPPSMSMMAYGGGGGGGAAPPIIAEMPAMVTGRCGECADQNVVLDGLLARHFDLQVCVLCKQDSNLRNGLYELIPKSRAKAEYALPDSSFHGLPFVAKPNPRHESFAPLKLYLKKMVMDEAQRLYGDHDALEQEKASRKRKSYERAATRTKHLLKKRHTGNAGGLAERQGREEKKPAPAYVPVADRDHQHQFTTELFDASTDSWVKECGCGMKVQFEKW